MKQHVRIIEWYQDKQQSPLRIVKDSLARLIKKNIKKCILKALEPISIQILIIDQKENQ